MRNKTLFGIVSGLAVLTLTATGCGVSGGSDDSADSATKAGNCDVAKDVSAKGAAKGKPKGEITFQTTNLKKDFAGYFNSVIGAFEKQNPGTKVKWIDDPGDDEFTQRLVANAQACKLADVSNLNFGTTVALTKSNYLVNLDDKAPGSGKAFGAAMWDSTKFAGGKGHTGLPWYAGARVTTLNTELLKKAGMADAKSPTTVLGEFDLAKKIAAKSGGKFYGMIANPAARMGSDWASLKVKITQGTGKDKKFTFGDDPNAIAWTAKLAELYKAGAMPKDTLAAESDPSKPYSEGKVAFGSTNASFLRYIKDNTPKLYPVTKVGPAVVDKLGHDTADPQYMGVSRTTENLPTALAFAKFVTNAKNQLAFAKLPGIAVFPTTTESLKDPYFSGAKKSDDPLAEARRLGAEALRTATADQNLDFGPAAQAAVVAQVQLAMQGKQSPADAMKAAEKKANDILANGS